MIYSHAVAWDSRTNGIHLVLVGIWTWTLLFKVKVRSQAHRIGRSVDPREEWLLVDIVGSGTGTASLVYNVIPQLLSKPRIL